MEVDEVVIGIVNLGYVRLNPKKGDGAKHLRKLENLITTYGKEQKNQGFDRGIEMGARQTDGLADKIRSLKHPTGEK